MTPVTRGRNDLWGGLIVAVGVVLAVIAFTGVSLFQIAAVGFFAWLALARKQGWAWLPASFFGFHVAQDLLDGVGGSLFFPLMVVAAGVLMLSRDRLSKNATIGILLMLAVIGIASSNRNSALDIEEPVDRPASRTIVLGPPEDEELAVADLDGRDLVIDAGSRDVNLTASRSRAVKVLDDMEFELTEGPRFVSLDLPEGEGAFDIAVPAEAKVIVRSTSGDVRANELNTSRLEIDTVEGDIEIQLDGQHAVTADTAEGEIDAEGIEDFDPAPNSLATDVTGSRVRLESVTGSISISQS